MIDVLLKHPFFEGKTLSACELLATQGYCNENYLVVAEGIKYIVRKLLRDDINRDFEWKVQKRAYEQGITAEPLVYDEVDGFMVFEFLEGEHKNLVDKDDLRQLAQTLKKLHSITIDMKPIKLQIKHQSIEVQKAFKSVDNYSKEYVLCHNDLNPQNIFFTHHVKLIDWEYAGVNDRYFDLACVCVDFALDSSPTDYFLASYFEDKVYHQEKLEAFKILYKALCKEWFSNENIKPQRGKYKSYTTSLSFKSKIF